MYCWYLLVQSLFFVYYTTIFIIFLSSLLVRFHIFLSSMKHRTVASYHFISVCFSEGCPRILVTSSKGIKRSCLKIGDPNGSKLKHSMFLYLFLYRANAVLTSGFVSLQKQTNTIPRWNMIDF